MIEHSESLSSQPDQNVVKERCGFLDKYFEDCFLQYVMHLFCFNMKIEKKNCPQESKFLYNT